MTEPKKRALVPKLRFPEFRDKGEWEKGKIADIFKLEEKSEKANEFDSERIITVKLHANGVVKNERTSTLTGGTNYFKRRANDFIFSKIDLLNGAFGLVPEELDGFYSSSDVPSFAFKENSSPFFFLNWLKANYQNLHIERTGTSSTLKRVAPSQFLDVPMLFPCIEEQQKIADCLSSLDELVSLEAQKLDTLKIYKKGLMQQLFPAYHNVSVEYSAKTDHPAPSGHPSSGGEDHPPPTAYPSLQRRGVMNQEPKNSPPVKGEYAKGGRGLIGLVPKLRFPEFRDKGEWEEKNLHDLFHFQDGFAFKSTDFVDSVEGATQVIRITDINNRNTNNDKVFIPNEYLESNALDKYFVESGDLLLSLTGAAGFNFFFWNGPRSLINQRTAKVTPKKKIDSALARLLEALVHHKINDRGEGQNNNLSKEFLSSVTLMVPKPAEQQKIADCLSSLDDLIAAQAQKIEALKAHKKGLMQQLFPVMNEVKI